MKKLYSLVAAVAVVLSASAANNVKQEVNDVKKIDTAVELQAAPTFKALDLSKVGTSEAFDKARKVRKAGETVDPSGVYANFYFQADEDDNDWEFTDMVEFFPKEFGEGWVFYNFYGMGSDIDCTLEDVEISNQTYPALVIKTNDSTLVSATNKFGFTTPAFVYQGNTYYITLVGNEVSADGYIQLYSNDIELVYANGNLILPYDDCGIGYFTLEGRGGWIKSPQFFHVNGVVESDIEDFQTEAMVPYEGEVYGEVYENNLLILGFLEYPCPLIFTFDKSNGAAQAVNQVAMQNTQWGDFYYMGVNADGSATSTLRATIDNTDDGCTLTFLDSAWITYADGVGYWDKGENTVVTFDFTIDGLVNGVKTVSVDNSDAAVEYFNLQGIRVSEPAAGNLYIRRQGSDVQKVLVK